MSSLVGELLQSDGARESADVFAEGYETYSAFSWVKAFL